MYTEIIEIEKVIINLINLINKHILDQSTSNECPLSNLVPPDEKIDSEIYFFQNNFNGYF